MENQVIRATVKAMKTELTEGGSEALLQGRTERVIAVLPVLLGLCITTPQLSAGEPLPAANRLITQPLSRAEAINVALRQNPSILRAQKDVAAAHGVMIQTRAIAIPKIRLTGNYTAVEPTDVDKPPASISGFSFGTDQSWTTQLRLVQSIYEGGRMASAFRAAADAGAVGDELSDHNGEHGPGCAGRL